MDRSQLDSMVTSAKKGDKDAFCTLYETVYSRMYRIAFYALHQKQDAEDAVMEAVTDAFRTMSSLRDPAKFEPWIFAILSKKIARFLKGYRNKTVELTEETTASFLADDSVLDVRSELFNLDDTERLIVVLSAVSGYQGGEIAKILGMPAGTVRSKLSRSLAKLRVSMLAKGGTTHE